MSVFTEFRLFSRVQGTEITYVLDAPLIWEVGKKGSGWRKIVPGGTKFDISVPRIFRWYLSPHDPVVLPCAALHDQLLLEDFDRPFASAEFRRAVLARGASGLRGWVLFLATLVWTVATQTTRRDVWRKRR